MLLQQRRDQHTGRLALQANLPDPGVGLSIAERRRIPPAHLLAQFVLAAADGLEGVSSANQRLELGAGTNAELRLHDGHQRCVLLRQCPIRRLPRKIVRRGMHGHLDVRFP